MDPRPNVIGKRLAGVKRIVAVSGGKGGIGKSSVAAVLALCMAEKGYRTGLLDLDFCGPSSHVILGAGDARPVEEKGLIPPAVHGIEYMSIVFFAGDNPSPLRGVDISNGIIELLAVTIWSDLDILLIDMPPGIGDAILDVIRLFGRMEFLTVTTPSRLTGELTRKELRILHELGIKIVGVLENMRMKGTGSDPSDDSEMYDVPFLGSIDLDSQLEGAMGDATALLETGFARQLNEVANRIGIGIS